jgi:hypothetical protein
VGVVIRRLDTATRIGVVANATVAATALWFAVRTGGGPRLGPARTDDLPYGDLISLSRSGSLVWLAVAVAGLAGLVLGLRAVVLIAGGMWLLLAVVGAAVVIGDGDLFGMSRPGDIAVALGLAATAVVAGLPPTAAAGGAAHRQQPADPPASSGSASKPGSGAATSSG